MVDDDKDYNWKRLVYDGTRGASFRTFKRDFLTKARARFGKDDRHSFYSAFNRMDEGGTGVGAPAMPNQAGGAGGGINPQFTAATTKRAARHGMSFGFLYDCFSGEGGNTDIAQMLSDLADTSPAELPADAWDLVINQCDENDDDLELQKMNRYHVWRYGTCMR
jgi:hypothetical protein